MKRLLAAILFLASLSILLLVTSHVLAQSDEDSFGHPEIGREVSIPVHLQDGQEYGLTIPQLIAFSEKLFTARWTSQEGAGRPLTIFQATLPVPGGTINTDPHVEAAIVNCERQFRKIGCATCHVPALPLDNKGWIYTEPNPYNPPGNLQPGDAPPISIDLTSGQLPGPRLKPVNGVINVPAYTDLKLHNICNGPDDPNTEPLNQNQPAGSPAFFAGNQQFITRKLWGLYNSGPFMHHGQFTTMREANLAHHGEAELSGRVFRALSQYDRDSIIEFLKSLQVLPPGSQSLCVDQGGRSIVCPPGIEP